jgi:uncharacterized membrane protein (UPF0127 family)
MPMLASLLLAVAAMPLSSPDDEPRFISQRYFQLKDLKTAKITLKEKHPLTAWVMDDNPKRTEGMMFVKDTDITEQQAMIFVFSVAQELRFWMRNTLVPLDIAYIDPNGRIVKTYTMRALDENTDYSSQGRAMFALETKAGLFKKLEIKAGDYVQIPSTVKAKD